MRQWRTNKAPTGAGSGDSAGARGLAPVKQEREAFPQKGEQTERAFHPVDETPERFCGPAYGKETASEFPKPAVPSKPG